MVKLKFGSLAGVCKPSRAWTRESSPHGWVHGAFAKPGQSPERHYTCYNRLNRSPKLVLCANSYYALSRPAVNPSMGA